MNAAELAGAIAGLRNVLITRYVSAAGFVLILYDHALTLGDEVEYIWSAPTSVAKSYVPAFAVHGPKLLDRPDDTHVGQCVSPPVILGKFTSSSHPRRCKGWISFAAYAGWLSIVISNFLVLLRIWTTLPHGNRLRVWSIVFFVVAQLASFATTSWVVANMIPVLIFDSRVGLCSFSSKPDVVGLWVVGLAYEVVVFVTVCWNTLDRPRALGSDPDAAVTRMLFRDGVVYFVILFALRIANTVIAIVSPVSSLFVIVFFIWASTTVTTSRLIINSRRAAGRAARLRRLQMSISPECEPECTSESLSDSRRLSDARMGTLPRRLYVTGVGLGEDENTPES
ncbi:hypothetical protein MVEN_01582400 [Mycena venus]|uniref:DUF6533 domain-containing protein n=1 Tax=Mycena venus TaxID=2733690 RepID=A0A8H6XS78_9AGAR|nr:hypothetical protein MVEN_01582400 [Mycena venus]